MTATAPITSITSAWPVPNSPAMAAPGEPAPPPAKARAEAPSVETPVATLALVERKALCSDRLTLLMLLLERTPLMVLVDP